MNEPIKHHFIPQFILRNFTFSNDQIYYWNKENNKLEIRNTKTVYMVENLYRDEKNHPTDPAIIERKFAALEQEIATLIKTKILGMESITITRADNEKLRKFLYLLSFRSSHRKQQYIEENFTPSTKKTLDDYTENGDYVDLWLRELEIILDCENYEDLDSNEEISWVIKKNYINHIKGYYMTFVTPRGQDFIIGDVYPTAEIAPIDSATNLYPHFLYPITPRLMLILNHIAFKKELIQSPVLSPMTAWSKITGNAVITPKPSYRESRKYSKEDTYRYNVNKIYVEDVKYLNALMLNEVKKGFSFVEINKVIDSLNSYQDNPGVSEYNKNNYESLLREFNE